MTGEPASWARQAVQTGKYIPLLTPRYPRIRPLGLPP